jgi:tRNA-Thr(GGU) m(6)t(6)A37 methyltransferase TsaA
MLQPKASYGDDPLTDPSTFGLRPIGTLHTPWYTIPECPRNGRQPDPAPLCLARVDPLYQAGLRSLDGFSHLILLYWLGQNEKPPQLLFTPPFDTEPHGIFATRGPRRPNPIGLSVVALEGIEAPDCLKVRYLDCLDGTVLLDIKPYLATTDSEPDAAMGWLDRHATRRQGAT